MLEVNSDQWIHWLSLYFWTLLRILALIASAPILSERAIAKRVKISLALMITFIIAPNLPATGVTLFSPMGFWLAAQQILIGIAIGFTMQFAFATFFDPSSRLNMPVLARLLDMLSLLLFLVFNGHLWMISLLVDTFHTLPIGGDTMNSNAFMALTRSAGLIFVNGLMLALPLVTLLLMLNTALGLLNRMAPQLSVFVIGFPLTLNVGIMVISALMPLMVPFCEHLFGEIFNLLSDIVGEISVR